jgi:restriction system protein
MGQRVKSGVFITTSSFSPQAMDYVKSIDAKNILTGGKRLADLMIEHNVGVTTVAGCEIKRSIRIILRRNSCGSGAGYLWVG